MNSEELGKNYDKIARKKHPEARFVQADFLLWDSSQCFDLIITWDSLFHAPREIQEKLTGLYLSEKVKGVLRYDFP